MTNQPADNAVEMKTHVSSGDQRVASLRAAVGGVLNWNTRHKFRPNHLIVSVLLERISSHAKLLGVPVLSCSLPSCLVFVAVVCVCWTDPVFSVALFRYLILFTFSFLANHYRYFVLSVLFCVVVEVLFWFWQEQSLTVSLSAFLSAAIHVCICSRFAGSSGGKKRSDPLLR